MIRKGNAHIKKHERTYIRQKLNMTLETTKRKLNPLKLIWVAAGEIEMKRCRFVATSANKLFVMDRALPEQYSGHSQGDESMHG